MMATVTCIKASSLQDGIIYSSDENKKKAKLVSSNLIMSNSPKQIAREFNLIDTGWRCQKPIFRLILSASNNTKETISSDKWAKILIENLQKLGLDEDYPHVAWSHHDTGHQHLHVYISRKSIATGKIKSQHNIGIDAGIAADKVSEKYGYARPKEIKKSRREEEIKSWEQDNAKSIVEIKSIVFHKHEKILQNENVRSYETYVSALKKEGIVVRPVLSRVGVLRGFSYECQGLTLKASSIHPKMSFYKLSKELYPAINFKTFKKGKYAKLKTRTSVETMHLVRRIDEISQINSSTRRISSKFKTGVMDSQESKSYSSSKHEFEQSRPDRDNENNNQDSTDFEKQEPQESIEESRQAIYLQHLYIINQLRISSEEEYIKAFAKANIKVLKVLSTNGFVNGFRYDRMGNSFKGSDVHRSMSLSNIRRCFEVGGAMAGESDKRSSLPSIKNQSPSIDNLSDFIDNTVSHFIPSSKSMTDESEGGFDETLNNKKKRKKGLRR